MFTYQVLIRLFSPIIGLFIIVDSLKRQGGKQFIQQRLGFAYPKLPQVSKRIWIHCASVGELKAAEPLIHALESQYHILITTNTPTGYQLIQKQYQHNVDTCYLPLDWPFAIRHFLKHCQPTEAWIIETEIWPNLYLLCAKHKIPLSILNARLSHKTLNAPRWLKKSYYTSLQSVQHIFTRSQTDAQYFKQLGAPSHTVCTLGNLKFAQLHTRPHAPNPMPKDYILLASSHADEEYQISQIWKQLNRPELLVIVPRHPHRSSKIQTQITPLFPTLKVASLGETPLHNTQLFLDDRLGVLMPLFEHAKLVIMGGSFVPKGGHNILEPAAYQKPIITGHDIHDFSEEFQLLERYQGILQCPNYQALEKILPPLLDNQEQRHTLGRNALRALQSQQHILKNYLAHLI